MVSVIKYALAGLLLLFAADAASAQCNGQFAVGQACGNAKGAQAPPTGTGQSALLDAGFGNPSPRGSILNRGASVWTATQNPVLGNPGSVTGTLGLSSASGGTATLTPPPIGGNTVLQLPTLSGTIPTSAISPIVINAATGVISCPTCSIGSSSLVVGSTPVSGATAGQVLSSDGSILRAYGITGVAGSVVLSNAPTVANLTVTGSFTATGLVSAADLFSTTTTVNGVPCTLGGPNCVISATATSVTIGSTTIIGGTPGFFLYNNSGVFGNLATTGTAGNVVLSVGPTLTGTTTMGTANITALQISGTPEVFPASGLIVGTTDTQTLSGKSMDGGSNTFTNIDANASLVGTTLHSTIVTSSLTTVGTIGAGAWQATVIGTAWGGTGVSSPTTSVIYKGQGASPMSPSGLTDNGSIITSSEPIDLTTKSLVIEVANAGTTGTTVTKLAKLSGAPSTALIAATTDTGSVVGVVIGGAGTTGSAQIAVSGQATCAFDGATTAGHYVQNSSSVAGDCSDVGATYPGTGQVIGRVLGTNGGAGAYAMVVFPPEIQAATGGGGGTITSVALVAGAFLKATGTCSSTSAINCTVSSGFLGGSLATTAGAI